MLLSTKMAQSKASEQNKVVGIDSNLEEDPKTMSKHTSTARNTKISANNSRGSRRIHSTHSRPERNATYETQMDLVIIHDESNIQVLIKIFSCNKTISLEVKPSDTIQKIKSIIREEEDIPEHQQFDLILAGEKLDDDKTLSACQILNGTTLNLIRWFAIDHSELK